MSAFDECVNAPPLDPKVALAAAGLADEEEQPNLLAGLRNGAWLDAQEFPPLTFAVPGILPEGLALNVGAPKIGKSWFVLGAALAVASGGIAFGAVKVETARRVLYLALEDGDRRLQERCRRLLARDPIPAGLDYLTRVEPGQVVATIAAWLDRHGPDKPLVIVDTLGKVMPPSLQGESAYQRDYRVGSTLKRLCDSWPGTAMLVNHHDRKANSEDFVDSVSGTHGLAGAADTIIVLSRDRNEETGLLKVVGRDVPEGEYAVRFVDGYDWQLDGADLDEAARKAAQVRATAGLGDRSAEIVSLVAAHPEGVRPSDVASILDGIDGDTAGKYLRRLADAGRIYRGAKRGLYFPVRSVRTSGSGETSQVSGADLGSPVRTHAARSVRNDASGVDEESTGSPVRTLRTRGVRNEASQGTLIDLRNRRPFGHSGTSDTPTECAVCGSPLDPETVAAGDVAHPSCEGAPS